jgi:hypothetical protein
MFKVLSFSKGLSVYLLGSGSSFSQFLRKIMAVLFVDHAHVGA